MMIGLDFDNTLVRYDEVFHDEAVARGLIPADVPAVKEQVRDRLRRDGREDAWTELQGWTYGPGMAKAKAFPGVREFLTACRARGVAVRIISHRTRKPFLGPAHDLHAAAREWLKQSGFLGPDTDIRPEDVYFEETKPAKLARIAEQGCTHFIDDLPEFLSMPGFPAGVERLLFDPAGGHAGEPFPRLRSWDEAAKILLGATNEDLTRAAALLCARAGLSGAFKLEPVPGAANNRVFRVRGRDWSARLKAYYDRPDDPRDRLGAEFAFAHFAWGRGVRALARPLASDVPSRTALYDWLEGRRLEPAEADAGRVREALAFFVELNRHKDAPGAELLADGSEACFTLEAHRATIHRRVENLLSLSSPDAKEAAAFARERLVPALAAAEKHLTAAGLSAAPLSRSARVLSPSDFGFHNAVLGPDGKLGFLDFEYAGWDDPAKTVCDFFLQPAVPAPLALRGEFARGVGAAVGDEAGVAARVRALAPLYRVKWTCIALNDFLPAGHGRRRFALGEAGFNERRARQLKLARRLLDEAGRDAEAS
jgi:hypothetical protein